MKKSYIKMLMFQGVILLIFILNSFVSNILKGYNFVLFLGLALVLFKMVFKFERDRNRYTKDVILEILIFLLIYFILFYIFGLVIGFARTGNYYNWYGLKTFIVPIILTIILKEVLRYMILKKSEGNTLLLVTTVILFVFLDITQAIYYNDFQTSYNTFIFVALSLLPAISTNIACCYITKKAGYKPVIFYLLVMRLYQYLIPIIPNPNEYLTSIINLILPIVLVYRISNFIKKEKDEYINRDYKKDSIVLLLIPSFLIATVVYFTSGYFHYSAIAIASGSMEPSIKKGDVVIIEKIGDNYESLKVGQVIAFKYNNIVVVHRLIKIIEDRGEYYFYTKGDNNNTPDNYAINESMIVGKVNVKIPFIGFPTVWLNET